MREFARVCLFQLTKDGEQAKDSATKVSQALNLVDHICFQMQIERLNKLSS
jgi:hypothetical protein